MLRLALYQPEIPQNTGTLLRLGSCLGFSLDIIHPCGFSFHDKHLQRAGLDYIDLRLTQHYDHFTQFYERQIELSRRLILVTPAASAAYHGFEFSEHDTLIMGQESSGFPDTIHAKVRHHIRIPMQTERRSINMALAAAIVMSEALRQCNLFPSFKQGVQP